MCNQYKLRGLALFAFAVMLMLGACERLRPIYEVQGQAISAAGKALSLGEVESRITQAGTSLGWLMKPVKPGVLRGTLRRGRHSAVVRIEYDAGSYDILYDSSQRMYEGTGSLETRYEGQRVIHKRYNKYVKNLKRQIDSYLFAAGS
jgi:hypothetical protein